MEQTKKETATEATGKDVFRARLITHLGPAEIEVVDRLLDAGKAANR